MNKTDEPGLLAARVSEAGDIARDVVRFTADQVRLAAALMWRLKLDVLLAIAVGAAVSAYAMLHWLQVNPQRLLGVFDIWFESDMPRIAGSLIDRVGCMHARTTVHPLSSLLLATPAIVAHALGVSENGVVTGYIAAGAFTFGAILYATVRTLGLHRIDSVLVSALTATSAASVFWLSTPENYAWGAATILLSMLWLAAPRGRHDLWTGPVQSALSLAITVTNWMAGLIAAVMALGVRRAIMVSAVGLVIVAALQPVQYELYPRAGGFLNLQQEALYSVLRPEKAQFSPLKRLVAMGDHVFVAPKHVVVAQNERLAPFKLSFQTLEIAQDPIAAVALVGWLLLMALGVWAALRGRVPKPVAIAVGILIGANVLLHMVYGEELFLYSMHFISLYALVAAWACLGTRWIALPLIVVTAVAGHLHNGQAFTEVIRVVNSGELWPHITGSLMPPCP